VKMMSGNTTSFVLCDMGQDLQINFCNLLYLVFLYNFCYFRFRTFISFFFRCI